MSNMKVLVLWIESKKTSVIDKKKVQSKKNKHGEETVKAKWTDGKLYNIKIIAENGK